MAKLPTIEEMAQNVAEKALDGIEYEGKTLREWVKIILATDTNVGTKVGTNLAEVGTDCISRQQAVDALRKMQTYKLFSGDDMLLIDQAGAQTELMLLPPAQPEIIRCRECKFASGDSRICMKFDHSPIGELDFCAWAERRTDE